MVLQSYSEGVAQRIFLGWKFSILGWKIWQVFLTCNDLDGFFGFSKFNPRKSFDQPCHFNSWNPTGLYMYVPQTALALAHE